MLTSNPQTHTLRYKVYKVLDDSCQQQRVCGHQMMGLENIPWLDSMVQAIVLTPPPPAFDTNKNTTNINTQGWKYCL